MPTARTPLPLPEPVRWLPYPFPQRNKQAPKPFHTQVGYLLPDPPRDRNESYATSLPAFREWWQDVEDLITRAELLDPVICKGHLIGWRPMTPTERERSQAASERAAAAAAKRKQTKDEQERALLAKLLKKHGRPA